MKSLVLGAGGFLGLNLVDALCAADRAPLCGTRRTAPRVALRRRGCDLVLADLDRPDTLVAAMDGVEVVYHMAGHYPALSLDLEGTRALALRQTENALDAAARAGVRRFVFLSTIATAAPNPSGRASESDRYPRAPGFGVYHDVKWAMEERVLAEDRFEVAVACPGACLGPWDQRIGTSALVVAIARGLRPLLPDGVVNLVDARDVALAMASLGAMAEPPRRVLLSAENLRTSQLGSRLARRYGAPEPRLLSAKMARRFADAEERRCQVEGGRPALAREIADLVTYGVEVDASLSAVCLGLVYRPLEQTFDAFDAWARARRIIPSLVAELS